MKKINNIFAISFILFLMNNYFSVNTFSQTKNNFYVIASVGNNLELKNNTKINVGNKIDIGKYPILKVDKYIAGIYEFNNVSFEFRGPGMFNIDSAIKVKKITNSKEKLIAFIANSVKGAEEGKNIKSASVEMSINSKVVTFPSISKQSDSIFTLYWNLNSSFSNSKNNKTIYSLIILNENNDTCYFKYHANNSVILNSNNFICKNSTNATKNNIYHWFVTAYEQENDAKVISNPNTFILETNSNLTGSSNNLQIDSLMQKLDYSLKNAYYSKSLEYAKVLNNISPGTGRAAVQYSLNKLLDYNNEDSKVILPILFEK